MEIKQEAFNVAGTLGCLHPHFSEYRQAYADLYKNWMIYQSKLRSKWHKWVCLRFKTFSDNKHDTQQSLSRIMGLASRYPCGTGFQR